MSKVIDLTNETFESEVLNSDLPVLVDFWAPWCMPCKMMTPTLEEMSEELAGKLKIAKVNVEEPINQNLAAKYQIQSIPNMKLFKGGQVVKDFVGLRDKEGFITELNPEL
ncbi:MAG: thioredoxin [Patescibacteria group bacterium]|jgi:thioredoxin 1|nr:thioredoxin [Patescibacteria group bacterium]